MAMQETWVVMLPYRSDKLTSESVMVGDNWCLNKRIAMVQMDEANWAGFVEVMTRDDGSRFINWSYIKCHLTSGSPNPACDVTIAQVLAVVTEHERLKSEKAKATCIQADVASIAAEAGRNALHAVHKTFLDAGLVPEF